MPRGKKATIPESDSKTDRIDLMVASLSKRFPGKILRARDYTPAWALRRLPLGILDLDIALNGGLPAGGMTMIVGKPNAGKNWLLCRAIAMQQQIYGDEAAFALIGTELPFDKGQARLAGVKIAMSDEEIELENTKRKNMTGKGLSKAEVEDLKTEIGTFVIIPPSTAETSFDIAIQCTQERLFNIVGIDSFGSILPEEEKDKTMGDAPKVSGPSGLNTRLMRRLCEALAPDAQGRPNLTCLIGINQVRDNLKAMSFSKQQGESGGWSLKHGRFVTLELTRTGWITKNKTSKVRTGKTMKWEITKQKAGGHEGHFGEYDFLFAPTLHHNRAALALKIGIEAGIVDKAGNTYSYNGTKLGVGFDNAVAALDKAGVVEDIEDEVMRLAGVSYVL